MIIVKCGEEYCINNENGICNIQKMFKEKDKL